MYSLTWLVFLLGLWCTLVTGQDGGCNNPRMRREIRELSEFERNRFFRAIRVLHSGPAPTQYDRFAQLHIIHAPFAHGTNQFFTWHREYILQFESLLQSIDSEITLPYWDWSLDASDPARSAVLSNSMMGTNGNSNRDDCLVNSPYGSGNWTLSYPNRHCLRRSYDAGDNQLSPWFTTEAVLDIINRSDTFQRFTRSIEALPHSRVHVGLGGSRGDMSFMYSTNDPIFWLHHAFIDRIFYEWQLQHPSQSHPSPNMNLPPFSLTNRATLNIRGGGRYCYTYPRLASSPTFGRGGAQSINMGADALRLVAERDNGRVAPLPEDWIMLNGFNRDEIRALESEYGVGKDRI